MNHKPLKNLKPSPALGRVFIVGAGPGAPDLLTLQAHKILQQAEVLLHDFLISKEILALVPNSAIKINVGHRHSSAGSQEKRQMQINTHFLQYTQQGKNVVRLKSGDAAIFGRAFEEARFLQQHQILFSIVPGISAGNAAANLCNIPLTERGQSQTVVFCTAQTAQKPKTEVQNLIHILETGGTVVLYMGLKVLPKWVAWFKLAKTTKPLVVCAAENVSSPSQKLVVGGLLNIQEKMAKHPMQSPVVFIIGQHCAPLT